MSNASHLSPKHPKAVTAPEIDSSRLVSPPRAAVNQFSARKTGCHPENV